MKIPEDLLIMDPHRCMVQAFLQCMDIIDSDYNTKSFSGDSEIVWNLMRNRLVNMQDDYCSPGDCADNLEL